MEHKVCFLYKTRQEVWYIHKIKNIPSHGYIQEININISYMDQNDNMSPTIEYRINDIWYKECELWDNKENFKIWYNNNFCCTKELEFEYDNAIWKNIDNSDIKVKVLRLFERTNNKHPWKKMKVAEIFYINKEGKGRFRFVPKEDIQFVNEKNKFTNETKYGLIRKFGEYYIEDAIYNFVCYDGIKF